MKNFKKCISLSLVLVLCLSMLVGCSIFPPKNASDLLKRANEAMEDSDNYSVLVDMGIEATLKGNIEGATMELFMPIDMSMSYDIAGEYAHGDMDMSASMDVSASYMGESQSMDEDFSQSAEVYMITSEEDGVVTTYTNKDKEGWVVSEQDIDNASLDFNSLMDDERGIFADADMEKDGDEYIVTLELADAFENDSFRDFLAGNVSFGVAGEDVDIDWAEFADSIEDAEVVYTFDAKTYFLKSVVIEEFNISDASALSGMDGMDLNGMDIEEFSMLINISMTFDNYGGIDASDVKAPKKVTKNAVEEDITDIHPEVHTPPTTEPEVVEPETTLPVEGDTPAEKPEGGETSENLVFYYEGTPVGVPTDYVLFLEDGWYPVDDGQYSSFLCLNHDKYEGMSFYLFTNDGSGTEEYVKNNGSDGFSIDMSYCDEYPDVSFAGITFGDSWEDVINALGEPNSEYHDDTYRDAEWEFTYCGKECTLSIVLLKDKVVNFGIHYWG